MKTENMQDIGRDYAAQEQAKFAEYNKPITDADVKTLQNIASRKTQANQNLSVNSFSKQDIEKTQKWAHKFYQQLGTKSPFFRAWYGDWRAHDTKPAEIVSFAYGESPKINTQKRTVYNAELKQNITVDTDVFEDSKHYATIN